MIRVLIADDHPAVRAGLAGELAGVPDIEVVGQAADGEETLRLAEEVQPDVVLLDVVMPGLRAGELVRRLRAGWPGLRVLVVTGYGEEALVLGLLRAGAQGYLLKEEELATVVAAVRGVMRGEMPLSPAVAAKVRQAALGEAAREEGSPLAQLTQREREVLALMMRGLSNAEVAEALAITERTVKFHVGNIYRKLGVRSRMEAILQARREGMAEI